MTLKTKINCCTQQKLTQPNDYNFPKSIYRLKKTLLNYPKQICFSLLGAGFWLAGFGFGLNPNPAKTSKSS